MDSTISQVKNQETETQNTPFASKTTILSDITHIPPGLLKGYIPSLDGFRAISIILVIFSHLAFNHQFAFLRKFELGNFGVHVFFVISGLLITTLLIKEKVSKGSVSLRNFYIRRFLRILPVAYLFLFVLFVFNLVFNLNLAAEHFLRPLFFVENFGDHIHYELSGHFWSLSVEEQFYLMFPFLISRNLKAFVLTGFGLILLTPIISFSYYHYFNHSTLFFILYHCFCQGMTSILIGSLSAIFLIKYPGKFSFNFKPIELVQLILLAGSVFFYVVKLPAEAGLILMAVCIDLLIISTIMNRTGMLYKFLNLKFIAFIGVLSYSLYIWQNLFAFDQPWRNAFSDGASIPLNMLFLCIISWLSYNYYEKYFLRLKDRFSIKK
jgi:peptidoglycan/LPS O-acetylase OafA/YrhL